MNVLEVKHVDVVFDKSVVALDDVSLSLKKGEVLGIVGESGSGKSTLVRTILGLQNINSGQIFWKNNNIHTYRKNDMLNFRKQVQMIFQDPLDALNPRMTISQIVSEPLRYLRKELNNQQIDKKTRSIIKLTGLSEDHLNRYPHEFSGGQCQRIGIARAMIIEPELLICDEPVSALDVSIQAQIINLLVELKTEMQLSMLFISHDLSIVRHLCDRILVLYEGKVVETASTNRLFASPQHRYTKQLLASIPLHDPVEERQRIISWGASSSIQAN